MHKRLSIIHELYQTYSEVISQGGKASELLESAIFSEDLDLLHTVLAYTPNSSSTLASAMCRDDRKLTETSIAVEIIRILRKHFSPLSTRARNWLIMHSCSIGDVMLLKEFSDTEPLFSNRVDWNLGRDPTYIHRAIRCSNIDNFRFLLDHGVIERSGSGTIWPLVTQMCAINRADCYAELYSRFEEARHPICMQHACWADNSEDMMTSLITEHASELLDYSKPEYQAIYIAQWFLLHAINRLRPGIVEYILRLGLRLMPPYKSEEVYTIPDDPFEIAWPYFNRNRDVFERTQAVLEAWKLPPLRIDVMYESLYAKAIGGGLVR